MKTHVSRVELLVLSLSLGLSVVLLSAIPASGTGALSSAALMPAPVPCNQSTGPCWKPSVKARWQYQLQGSPGVNGGCRYKSTGFVNIDFAHIATRYDAGKGLLISFPYDLYNEGNPGKHGTGRVRVNVAKGTVVAE
jgi:hypothetical protein